MALARVVSFEGVSSERVAEMEREMNAEEPPEGVRATEMVVLHDPDAEKSVVILFFDSESDYADADAVLGAMPADETPGRRTSVGKYNVAFRMKA
jgi:hypothetical protein